MPENNLPPSIEQAALLNLRTIGGDDDGFVAEIVQMFREDTPPHFVELADCVAKGDAVRLGKVAHSMKGSAGNFGAKHFRQLCERLEEIGRKLSPPLCPCTESANRLPSAPAPRTAPGHRPSRTHSTAHPVRYFASPRIARISPK